MRVVNGYGEFDYSEILVVVRVNQKESGSCRDFLGMALLKNVGVSAVRVQQGENGSPCNSHINYYHYLCISDESKIS